MKPNYLFRRQLSPILPPEYGGETGWITFYTETSCPDATGMNGSIKLSAVRSSQAADIVEITLRSGSATGPVVGSYTMELETELQYTFTGLEDSGYHITVASQTHTGYTTKTIGLACAVVNAPPSGGSTGTDIVCERIYTNPVLVPNNPISEPVIDPNTGVPVTPIEDPNRISYVEYQVTVWKFNTLTQQLYKVEFTEQFENTLSGRPQDYLTGNPFWGYCKPNTTTRRDWYYTKGGTANYKEILNAAVCGGVEIRGCTDPTATNYNANATVDDGTCYFRPQVFGCTNPTATNFNKNATDDDGTCVFAPEIVTPVFDISPLNSLRFVRTQIVDNVGVYQTPDNVLFCSEKWRGIRNAGYYQKVTRVDVYPIQIRSNFASILVQLYNYRTGQLVGTLPTVVKTSNTGESDLLDATLKNNTNGQTRVYFNTGDIPVPAAAGDLIVITNATGFNGTYAIVDVKQDVKLQAPYLVINKPYTSGTEVTTCDVKFQLQTVDYDVVECIVDWSAYPVGLYQWTITGTDPEHGAVTYTSEPVLLKERFGEEMLLIEYRNYENGFDMIYTTGILNRIRVEGELRERITGGDGEIHREPFNKLTRLRGVVHRKFRLNVWKLPAWLHEKLSVILRHDYVTINGVEYQCEEGYGEPEYNKNTATADSSSTVEQVEWFKHHNDHDLGSINSAPLLIGQGGYIRL